MIFVFSTVVAVPSKPVAGLGVPVMPTYAGTGPLHCTSVDAAPADARKQRLREMPSGARVLVTGYGSPAASVFGSGAKPISDS